MAGRIPSSTELHFRPARENTLDPCRALTHYELSRRAYGYLKRQKLDLGYATMNSLTRAVRWFRQSVLELGYKKHTRSNHLGLLKTMAAA